MGTTLATKADLQLLRQDLHQEIALVRKDMEIMTERMSAMSTNITMRLGSMMVGLAGLVFAALKLA